MTYSSIVCDAGGVLVAAGALEGSSPDGAEIIALDWTSMTVGRFLGLRHEGDPARVEVEIGLALAAVDEWFPVRSLVAAMLSRAGVGAVDELDSWSALVLAEQLALPLLTASGDLRSDTVEIVRPW
ncbi:MAG: hypothetical protein ACE367_00465 [Acidimicrobiales bacterium]